MRAKWRGTGFDSYTFTMRRSCFCTPEAIGPVDIRVRMDQVVSRTYTESGDSVTAYLVGWPTIDGLFDRAERALLEADQATVTYHPDFGYPTNISIDWIREAIDDEEALTVLSLTPER